jgi:hypothetical protein
MKIKMKSNITVIKDGKIKWTIHDSKENQYRWQIPIQTYESYLQNKTYQTQTIQYPDGQNQEIGEFSSFVKCSFANVIDEIYENSDGDADFVHEVWYIISHLTVYSPDIGEHPRYAIETLTRGGGDCEDTTILMADMIRSSSYTRDWKIQMVYFDSENPSDPRQVNHVSLVVDTGNYSGMLETTAKTSDGLYLWNDISVVGWWSDV